MALVWSSSSSQTSPRAIASSCSWMMALALSKFSMVIPAWIISRPLWESKRENAE
ncbi:hypothetical protein D3C72_2270100 [compost metagenome]